VIASDLAIGGPSVVDRTLIEREIEIGTRGLNRRRQPDEDGGEDGDSKSECEHEAVDVNVAGVGEVIETTRAFDSGQVLELVCFLG
jgi:hypothetical protein